MPPITIMIKPASSLCNMRCKYCFYSDVANNREVANFGLMDKGTLEALVQKALACADGFCTFAFQGGEPTLAGLDYYRKLLELQKEYNTKNITINNAIQTNGYVVNEEWAEFFAKNRFLVGLSLDGIRKAHDECRVDVHGKGTYDRIMKTAELFNQYGVEYNILCVVNGLNARHGIQVYQTLKKSGFRYLQFIPCLDPLVETKSPYSLKADKYAEFLKSTFDCYFNDFKSGYFMSIRLFDNYVQMLMGYPPESCSMNGVCSCGFVVEGDGGVYPCDFYVLDRWRLGSINDSSFEDMLNTPQAKEFVKTSEYVSPKCRECTWFKLCRGGCRRNREPFIDGRPALNQYCEAYAEFFHYAYDRLVYMAKEIMKSSARV